MKGADAAAPSERHAKKTMTAERATIRGTASSGAMTAKRSMPNPTAAREKAIVTLKAKVVKQLEVEAAAVRSFPLPPPPPLLLSSLCLPHTLARAHTLTRTHARAQARAPALRGRLRRQQAASGVGEAAAGAAGKVGAALPAPAAAGGNVHLHARPRRQAKETSVQVPAASRRRPPPPRRRRRRHALSSLTLCSAQERDGGEGWEGGRWWGEGQKQMANTLARRQGAQKGARRDGGMGGAELGGAALALTGG
jgi:hypothetical protein